MKYINTLILFLTLFSIPLSVFSKSTNRYKDYSFGYSIGAIVAEDDQYDDGRLTMSPSISADIYFLKSFSFCFSYYLIAFSSGIRYFFLNYPVRPYIGFVLLASMLDLSGTAANTGGDIIPGFEFGVNFFTIHGIDFCLGLQFFIESGYSRNKDFVFYTKVFGYNF